MAADLCPDHLNIRNLDTEVGTTVGWYASKKTQLEWEGTPEVDTENASLMWRPFCL